MAKTALERIVALALSQVGITESPAGSNKTKYGVWYGMNGQPWCDIFISWLAEFSGCASIIGKFAYTPSHANFFKKLGRWHTTPQVGDIVFFDFPDSVMRIQHVGLVIGVESGYIWTVEGNTSSGTPGSQDNGGMVAKRHRPRNSSIVGYGRPDYTSLDKGEVDEMESFAIYGGHCRTPEDPNFSAKDKAFIAEMKDLCDKYGKRAKRVSVPKGAYLDGDIK